MHREVKNVPAALNRYAVLTAAAALSACLAEKTYAIPVPTGPVVSIQFDGGYDQMTNLADYAGILSEPDWNYQTDGSQDVDSTFTSTMTSHGGSTPGTVLVDSTDSVSPITYSYNYDRVSGTHGNTFPGPVNGGDNDANLAGETAGVQGPAAVLTLSSLSGTYDIVAYVSSMYFGGGSLEEISLGPTNYYLTDTGSYGSWIQGTSQSSGSPSDGNYVEFDNLTGSSQTITVGATGGYYGLDGVEIVPVAGGVPEPAAIGTVSLLGLGLLRRRRRGAR